MQYSVAHRGFSCIRGERNNPRSLTPAPRTVVYDANAKQQDTSIPRATSLSDAPYWATMSNARTRFQPRSPTPEPITSPTPSTSLNTASSRSATEHGSGFPRTSVESSWGKAGTNCPMSDGCPPHRPAGPQGDEPRPYFGSRQPGQNVLSPPSRPSSDCFPASSHARRAGYRYISPKRAIRHPRHSDKIAAIGSRTSIPGSIASDCGSSAHTSRMASTATSAPA